MFKRRKKSKTARAADAVADGEAPSILDAYVTGAPSPQNAVDLFAGEWVSSFPGEHASIEAGPLSLCYDPRVGWGLETLGGIEGQSVLEIGPLEAGHSFMLEQAGAASVTAVESNSRAYLKCLIFKEIVGLSRTSFLLGDAIEYLRRDDKRYGFVLASGVLYHMRNPVELIALLSAVTDRVLFWTHYYDADRIAASKAIAPKFPGETVEVEHGGFTATLHRQLYTQTLTDARFCGGSAEFSHWMERQAILDCLAHFGFDQLSIEFEEPDHINGPCFSLAASRANGRG